MQCAVIGCSNHSNASECGDIVFYAVPKDLHLKEKWMKIIDTRKVIRKTYVCSNHFSDDDFFASGKMRKDAVPALVQACRICLAVGTKLCHMNTSELNKAYEDVTGLTAWDSNQLPHKLCWECAHRVQSSWRLRAKARRSHEILLELAQSQHYITTESILSIHRVENNLISTLSHRHNLEDLAIVVHEKEDTEKDLYLEIDVDPKSEDDAYLKGEINHSDDERSVSAELFTQENHIIVEPAEIKSETSKSIKSRSDKAKSRRKEPKIDRRKKPSMLNEEIFRITNLTIEEQHREIEKRKEKNNFKNSQLKCMICYKVFTEVDSQASHMIKHTDKSRIFECFICKIHFKTQRDLRNHINSKTTARIFMPFSPINRKSGIFECDICKIHFKTQRDLRNHMPAHTQKYTCNLCPYVTMRRNAARNHQQYHQGTVYSCPHCLEQFAKVSTYMSHVRIKHPSDFVCELCGNSFVNEKGVAMHKKLKHRFDDITVPPDGPRCEPCNIRFQSIEALNKHLLLSPKHSTKDPTKVQRPPRGPNRVRNPDEDPVSEGPISCEQCDEKLPNAVLYFQHFRRAHPDKNRTSFPSSKRHRSKSMCEVCGRMFQSLALLIDHSHTHTAKQQFSCEQCHKKFQRKYRLVQHLKLHAAVRKTYACPECGKRLSSRSNMIRHAFTHTGLKPFKCEMCGKTFKFASQKREHIAYVHMKKPWPKRSRGDRRTALQTQEASDDDQNHMWQTCE